MSESMPPVTPAARPRLWPAALIVLAYLLTLAGTLLSPTIIMNAMGVMVAPVVAAILLAIWWLFFSRLPGRERIIGILLFLATLAWIALSQTHDGPRLLILALPVLTTGLVAAMLLTARTPARVRYTAALAVMLACAAVFPLFRVTDVSGSLAPILSWRWRPTPDEAFAASAATPPTGAKADVPAQAGPLDWPGFRGPARDGRAPGVRFATNWNEAPPKELWRKRVGLGYSSFAVIGDCAYTQEQRQQNEAVVCYQASTGQEIWNNLIQARFEDSTGTGPRATPTFEAGKLYTQGATGILQCLDAATGALLWKNDLKSATGAKLPTWGFASSPLLTEKHVIIFTGGPNGKSVAAFHKATGQHAWSGGNGDSGYASAQLASLAGVPQVLMTSSYGLQSLALDTGALLWENQWPTSMNPRVVQPQVYDGNIVLVGTAEGKGTRCLELSHATGAWAVHEKWTTKTFRPYFNDFVYHQGHCYGFDGNTLTCIDAHTGQRRWKGPHCGGQLLLLPELDTLLILTEKGALLLVPATPEAFQETARLQALTQKTWNHPAIAQDKLLLRNAEEAACYQLPI